MKKHILITGGSGYIGSHIAYLLAQKGYSIISIDHHQHGQPSVGPWLTSVHGDIGDAALLSALCKQYAFDAVIHCAAFIDIADSIKNPLNFYQNNVSNTTTLLRIMKAHGIEKLLFSSSCAVYGSPHIIPMPEDHPKLPISPYGHSKLMAEQIITDACKATGIRAITFRYFNVVGAMPEYGLYEWHTPEIHLIPRLLQAVYEQRPFMVFGNDYQTFDGTCIRDFIHVWDVAHAHLVALEKLHEGSPSDTFNLGSGTGYSIKEIIATLEQLLQRSVVIEYANRRPGDPNMLMADSTRAKELLGFQPQFSDLPFILRSAHAAYQLLLERQNRLRALQGQELVVSS